MTLWHCNLAVSLDGKIARPDGGVDDWLARDYPLDETEFGAFLNSVDAILMGRGTFDVVQGMGAWPYPGKPTVVMTSRLLPEAPPEVEARTGDLGDVVAELEAAGHARIWIAGGGQLLRGMMALGKLDILEMMVIPVVLGDGIPLFPPGTPEMKLRLESGRPWIKGAMHLLYRCGS
ncbi:dihydrofolate reductase family protein [Pseudoroseomonas globiformis]|uniref:Dihydrofolate reductase family protein n=1 Tax=Teichococcus globiformis TaxID=2307229 RepID=A0ABV7G514_9PROT